MLRVPYPSAVYVAGELQSGRYHFFVCFVMTICRVFNAFLLQRNICQVLITNSRPCLKDELFLGGHLYRLGLELPWLGIAPCVSVPPKGSRWAPQRVQRVVSFEAVDSGCRTAAPWEAPNHTQEEEFLLVKPCRSPR